MSRLGQALRDRTRSSIGQVDDVIMGLSKVLVEYLVVAGGGGGGASSGATGGGAGGGGAGGYRESTIELVPGLTYTITIGAGGNGSTSTSSKGNNGSDSILSTITSTLING